MACQNHITLHGTIQGDPVHSHITAGMSFYQAYLSVGRLSGICDILPVLLPENMLPGFRDGAAVTVEGEIRSYNNDTGIGRKLILNVLASDWVCEPGPDYNNASLACIITKSPVLRRTPLGRDICDILCAVRRQTGKADYIPMIAWGNQAFAMAKLNTGDGFQCEGRFQSRPYDKLQPDGSVRTMTAYEISIRQFA